MWARVLLTAFLSAVCALAQQAENYGLAPETLLLARIKLHMSEYFDRLPNYTCTQTIERSRRRVPKRKYELVDTVRLEVALVGGKEYFSWPGAGKFEETEIKKLVPGGAIGNGNFALHARGVFLSGWPTFTYVGERFRDGRRTHRFDYEVPLIHSGYVLRVDPQQGIVGYHGSFWVDADTLDLLRLEVIVDDIPPHLPIAAASDVMEYAAVRIGERDFLLPQNSELTITDIKGNESHNIVRFSGCRQYSGESRVSFGDPPPDLASQEMGPAEIMLPAGLRIDMQLETSIETGVSALGDAVRARVLNTVKQRDRVLVRKGATALGRLLEFQVEPGNPPITRLQLVFDTIEFGRQRAKLSGHLDSVGGIGIARLAKPRDARVGILYLEGSRITLPKGSRFVWFTKAPAGVAQ